jgi:hypothetical protein
VLSDGFQIDAEAAIEASESVINEVNNPTGETL